IGAWDMILVLQKCVISIPKLELHSEVFLEDLVSLRAIDTFCPNNTYLYIKKFSYYGARFEHKTLINYQKLNKIGIADENDDGGKFSDSKWHGNVKKSESDGTYDPEDSYQDGIRNKMNNMK
ncbi:8245_t:CDS:2, partial [Racocetra persica]